MTGDRRFVRQCADVQQLLDVLDLDGVEDLEDLLMLLFRRPVDLTYPQDGSPGCIEVIVHGDPTRFKAGIPLGRLAEAQDVAQVVAFLVSDGARHVTMQDLVVDGGAAMTR